MNLQRGITIWVRIAGVILLAAGSLGAGKIVHPTPYDPVLVGAPQGPCDPALAGADVVGGTDVQGQPVRPADLPRSNTGGVPDVLVQVKRPHGNDVLVDAATVSPPATCDRSQ